MTALPKAPGMVEDHPLCRKTLSRGRFLWISAAGKNTILNTSLAEAKKQGEVSQREKKKHLKRSRSHAKHLLSVRLRFLICYVSFFSGTM